MTVADYQPCEDRVLAHEGSEYTDGVHPYDPGGPTRYGITIGDARAYWKKDATAEDVRNLPKSVAQVIYKTKYWDAVNGDRLPAGVDDCVFDYGVNSGNSRAGKVLRRLLSLSDADWHITDQVIAECRRRDSVALINGICDERLTFLQSLSIWHIYGRGWSIRVKEVRDYALQLAAHEQSPVSVPLPKPPLNPVPSGAGKVPPPSVGPIITGTGTGIALLGALAHWLGAHPVVTGGLLALGAIGIFALVSLIQKQYETAQEAPTPGLVPVLPRT